MMKYLLSITILLLLAACGGSKEYTCLCIDKGNNDKEVAKITLNTSTKETAAFECRQKNMGYPTGEFYKDVRCELKTEEE
ncbi:MAG: hypothetical protein R2800_15040 [Flavipsychrobacter sp.]